MAAKGDSLDNAELLAINVVESVRGITIKSHSNEQNR